MTKEKIKAIDKIYEYIKKEWIKLAEDNIWYVILYNYDLWKYNIMLTAEKGFCDIIFKTEDWAKKCLEKCKKYIDIIYNFTF